MCISAKLLKGLLASGQWRTVCVVASLMGGGYRVRARAA